MQYMKKAVVTGATGFIGSVLVKKLLKENVIVYGVGRDEKKLESLFDKNFIPITGDFDKFNDLHSLINDDIDVFFHLAWNGGFTTAFKNYELQLYNAKIACDAMTSAISMGVKKFIYGGTINEIEVKQYLNDPNYRPRFTCIHSAAKVAADMICHTLAVDNGIDYCSCIIPMPFGIGNNSPQVLNVLMKNCALGKPTKLIKGDNMYDVVHVEDIADAIHIIGEKGVNGKSYYIGHRVLNSFKSIMQYIKDCINPEAELLFGEYPEALNIDYSLIDINAVYNDTGYITPDLSKEKIIETSKWLVNLE